MDAGRRDRRHELLTRLTAKVQADEEVLALILFGSQARGEAGPNADVDTCLVMRADVSRARASEKRLDYLANFDLDLQVFQLLPLYIRHRVLREGKVLHCKDEDTLYELAWRTAQSWEDFKPRYQMYLEGIGGS